MRCGFTVDVGTDGLPHFSRSDVFKKRGLDGGNRSGESESVEL